MVLFALLAHEFLTRDHTNHAEEPLAIAPLSVALFASTKKYYFTNRIAGRGTRLGLSRN